MIPQVDQCHITAKTNAPAPPIKNSHTTVTTLGGIPVKFSLHASHLLPTCIQLLIFSYWALYWQAARSHFISIVGMIAFGLALDILISSCRQNCIFISLRALPIVFSINLFIWYSGKNAWISYFLIAIALSSKLIFQRNGRHIFNPSAFAISIAGILWICFPRTFEYIDISGPLSFPPNMIELIFLASLYPLSRFGGVIVAIAATLGMFVFHLGHFVPVFHPSGGFVSAMGTTPNPAPMAFWAPWFLTITLLATDPITIPRTFFGRFFYGIAIGTSMDIFSVGMHHWLSSDYFSKVFPVVLANFLSPRFDHLGARVSKLLRLPEIAHIGKLASIAWVFFFVVVYTGAVKRLTFVHGIRHHIENTCVSAIHYGPQGKVLPDNNLTFITPFSFVEEAASWFQTKNVSLDNSPCAPHNFSSSDQAKRD
jgi:hypothetical protein